MKYKAIIETDDFENFEFYEDGNGKYMAACDAGAVDGGWIPLHFTECENEPDECEDCVSRQAASSLVKNSDNVPSVTPTRRKGRREYLLNKIKAEIKEWYWQADKQALAKDPCVVDAMVDLFIRTIDKYKAGE